MSKKVTLTVGSETYTGRNAREANAAALAHLARLTSDNRWVPVIVRAPDGASSENTAIVYKEGDGTWAYTILWADGHISGSASGGWSRAHAEYMVRRHLAQAAYRPGGPDTFAILHETDIAGRADHASWIRFQEQYTAARAAGKTDTEARRIAAGY